MVGVPSINPFDTFRDPLVGMDFGYPDQYANKSQNNKNSVHSKQQTKSEKLVDVLVPQSEGLNKLYKKQLQTAKQPVQDDFVVPEFKAPASPVPAAANQTYQLPEVSLRPASAVPDLNFLDLDDWTSPFDLDLDFENIMYEWEDQNVFNNMTASMPPPMPRQTHAAYAPPSALAVAVDSEPSSDSHQSASEEEAACTAVETKPEEDEFTRNRRLCLERYREKKRNRRFSKKVRYHLRKMNADRRPRYKGRFIKKGEVIPKELLDN